MKEGQNTRASPLRGGLIGGIRGYKGFAFIPNPTTADVKNPSAIVLSPVIDDIQKFGKEGIIPQKLDHALFMGTGQSNYDTGHPSDQIRVFRPPPQPYFELQPKKKEPAKKKVKKKKKKKRQAILIEDWQEFELRKIHEKNPSVTKEEEIKLYAEEEEKKKRVLQMKEELQQKEAELKRLEEEYENENQQFRQMAQQILKSLRKIDPRSLYLFPLEWGCRQYVLKILSNKAFEYFMIGAILSNSVCLALYDYGDQNNQNLRNQILGKLDVTFTGIYSVEATLKIVGMGFVVHRKSYLRGRWNILDFVSLSVSYISLIPNIPNLKALRILRVMKPLRSINAIPSMKKLFNTLLLAIPHIAQVFLFLLFIFMVFGILGVQLFSGSYYQRCRLTPAPVLYPNTTQAIWAIDNSQSRLCGGEYTCNPGTYCGTPLDFGLPLSSDNITKYTFDNYGVMPFDDVGDAMLQIFRDITLEGWSAVMYTLMDAIGSSAALYYPVLLVVCSFLLLNLFVAVIMESFSEMTILEQQKDQAKKEQKARKQRQSKALKNGDSQKSIHERVVQKMINANKKKFDAEGSKARSMSEAVLLLLAQKNQQIEDKSTSQQLSIFQESNEKSQELKYNREEKAYNSISQKTKIANQEHQQNARCFQRFLLIICQSQLFQTIITSSIIANTICLSLDQYPPNNALLSILDIMNIIFFCIFVSEMLIKLGGMGPRLYVRDQFNIFDAFVVTISIIDIILTYTLTSAGGGKSATSAFRAFRLLRVFKLAKSWSQLQKLLKTIMQSLRDISSFSVIIFLLMFIYVLIGMEIFAYQLYYMPDGSPVDSSLASNTALLATLQAMPPRNNFNDFFHGFLVVFQVLQLDNWDTIVIQYALVKNYIAIAYLVSLVVIGVMFFLNIFLAILLENFGFDNEDEIKKDEASNKIGFWNRLESIFRANQSQSVVEESKSEFNDGSASKLIDSSIQVGFMQIEEDNFDIVEELTKQVRFKFEENYDTEKVFALVGQKGQQSRNDVALDSLAGYTEAKSIEKLDLKVNMENKQERNSLLVHALKSPTGITDIKSPRASLGSDLSSKVKRQENKKSLALVMLEKKLDKRRSDLQNNSIIKTEDNQLSGRSLCCLRPTNKLRIRTYKLVNHRVFEAFIIVVICFSSVLLSFDNPLNDPNGVIVTFLFYADFILTSIFTLECVLKVIAQGFLLNGKNSYLRIGWNILDFTIVFFSVLSLALTSNKFKIIKIFRLVRVMRPLRLISKNKFLKIAMQALLMAMPNIFNVIIVSLLFYVIFGIVAINYFKGSFRDCTLTTDFLSQVILNTPSLIVTTKWDCLNWGGEWLNSDQHFDSMQHALTTLFQISSTDAWAAIMYQGTDAVGIDYQPVFEHTLAWSLFFMLFVIFGNIFLMNLFEGAVVSSFSKEKARLGKLHLLSEKQKRWLEQKRVCLGLRPIGIMGTDGNQLKQYVRKFVQSQFFNIVIFSCIFLNTVVLVLNWYGEPAIVDRVTSIINFVCAGIFTIEACLKLYGFGFRVYFKDSWNSFDFLVVVVTVAAEITELTGGSKLGTAATFIRALRVQRLLRYIKKAKRIRVIFQTFIVTLPSLVSVGTLLLLSIYVFSVLGIFLFAEIMLQSNLAYNINFQSTGIAMLTLFRAISGEAWNYVMADTVRQVSILYQCDYGEFDYNTYVANGYQTYNCGSPYAGTLFFIAYQLVVPNILLNLFIAVILEGFETTNRAMSTLIQEDDLNKFVMCWDHFDPTVRYRKTITSLGIWIHQIV